MPLLETQRLEALSGGVRTPLDALVRLSDEEWRRLEPLLPRGRKRAHRVEDRRVISGITTFRRCVDRR
jgi:hypothetical protein